MAIISIGESAATETGDGPNRYGGPVRCQASGENQTLESAKNVRVQPFSGGYEDSKRLIRSTRAIPVWSESLQAANAARRLSGAPAQARTSRSAARERNRRGRFSSNENRSSPMSGLLITLYGLRRCRFKC